MKTISFRILKPLFHCLLVSNTTFEKSNAIMISIFVCVICFFLSEIFEIFSDSLVFISSVLKCLQVVLCAKHALKLSECITLFFSSEKLFFLYFCIIPHPFSQASLYRPTIRWIFDPQTYTINIICLFFFNMFFYSRF